MAEDLITQVSCSEDEQGLQLAQLSSLATQVEEEKQHTCWRWFCFCSPCFGRKPKNTHLAVPSKSLSLPAVPLPLPPKQTPHTPAPNASSCPTDPSAVGLKEFLLGPLPTEWQNRKTLVLDLDETLVHSSFKPIPNADFMISIDLEGNIHRVYVRKRPGVDAFLKAVGEKFEVVIFTASLAKYADPLLDILDRNRVVAARLFREACVQHYGNYVKDLTHLGRPLENSIIVDNSPFSYMFQPDNAIPITSWFNDKNDRQLYDLLPFLDKLAEVDDVCTILGRNKMNFMDGDTPPQ